MYKKILLALIAIYIAIGVLITWKLDPGVRGGFVGGIEFTIGWPLIFLNPIH